MPRNAEVIRQWTILREIERARGAGVTIDDLAALCDVTTRTIRRDLQALEEAGFPLFDDKGRDDGKTRWLVNGQAFKGLAAGLTLSELCALYFARTRAHPDRVLSNMLIALGAFVPSLASGLSRFGITSVFFWGELLGLLCILAGFVLSTSRSRSPTRNPAASSEPS